MKRVLVCITVLLTLSLGAFADDGGAKFLGTWVSTDRDRGAIGVRWVITNGSDGYWARFYGYDYRGVSDKDHPGQYEKIVIVPGPVYPADYRDRCLIVHFTIPITLSIDPGTKYLVGDGSQYKRQTATPKSSNKPVGPKKTTTTAPPGLKAARKGATKTNPNDGSAMVIIPAGNFIMGSSDGGFEEKPAHKVYLDGYQIGKYEVTVAQYRKFCNATGRKMPTAPMWGWKNDHPIVYVTWYDAAAYCKWAGGRLPTEAEWEKAARGTDGRTYPWGNTWEKNKCANHELKLSSTVSVGSYRAGASPYGCMDMAGNVAEWCADWYALDYYQASPSRDPKGPPSAVFRVVRGGCWVDGGDISSRCASRCDNSQDACYYGIGFRLAR